MDPVVKNDVQVCLYLNSQYSLVLSLCSSKHKFCEAISPTSILECNSHKIKIHVYFHSVNILNFVISGLTIWMSIPYLAIKA